MAQEPPASESPGSIAQIGKFCGLPLHPLNQNWRVGAKDIDLFNSIASQVIVSYDEVKNQWHRFYIIKWLKVKKSQEGTRLWQALKDMLRILPWFSTKPYIICPWSCYALKPQIVSVVQLWYGSGGSCKALYERLVYKFDAYKLGRLYLRVKETNFQSQSSNYFTLTCKPQLLCGWTPEVARSEETGDESQSGH